MLLRFRTLYARALSVISQRLGTALVAGLILGVAVTAPVHGGGARETREQDTLVLYSGRGEALVAPVVERFRQDTGINVRVRYAGTSELAVLLQEEGAGTPAELFWAQDAGALGALSSRDLLWELPDALFANLPGIYRSSTGHWVATSGRARVLAYSPARVRSNEHPESVFELTDSRYRGRVGWAPSNGSFQSFITAMRARHGDDRTREWLEAMKANGVESYRNNTALVQAIAAGEIDFALTNHYYLLRFLAEDPSYPVAQRFFSPGDTGNLVNVAGVAVPRAGRNRESAVRFIEFLLSLEAQQYFTESVFEYPVIDGMIENPNLEQFADLLSIAPGLDLDTLEDLEGTLDLLRQAGVL